MKWGNKMFCKKNIKYLAIGTAAIIAASGILISCGSKTSSSADKSASQTIGDQYPSQYKNYIESFTAEVEPFVKEDLAEILKSVSGLNSSNYQEWKTKYSSALEKTEHWYNEVGSAEMFCPNDKAEQHQALVMTSATIYKILEGMNAGVAAADSGDFSQLTSKSAEYAQAAQIASDMWDHAINDLKIDEK